MNQGRNMQAKSESPEWMHEQERGSRFWLAVMCMLSHLFGRPLSRIVLHGIALYFLIFARKARHASYYYLTRSLGRPVTWRDRYRHILFFATTIHDRLYILRDKLDLFRIDATGTDSLHQHHAAGQGLLLFGAHLGSFEVLRAMAARPPYPTMAMAMYPENAKQINQALATINPKAVQDIIPLGTMDAMLTIHRRLKAGAMVGLLADRASGPDHYHHVPFLGKAARFPTGPFRMAAMLGQPVYFMTGLYQGKNHYQIHFELLDDGTPCPGEPRDATCHRLLESYVAALERQCCAHPFNWFNFYDFWEDIHS